MGPASASMPKSGQRGDHRPRRLKSGQQGDHRLPTSPTRSAAHRQLEVRIPPIPICALRAWCAPCSILATGWPMTCPPRLWRISARQFLRRSFRAMCGWSAPRYGLSIIHYDADSRGAQSYRDLAKEVRKRLRRPVAKKTTSNRKAT